MRKNWRLNLMRCIAAAFALMNGGLLALAQDGEASASPAGLSMLILFLGVAAIVGVFVIRWSQAASDDE